MHNEYEYAYFSQTKYHGTSSSGYTSVWAYPPIKIADMYNYTTYYYQYTAPRYYYNTAIKTPAYYAYTAAVYQYTAPVYNYYTYITIPAYYRYDAPISTNPINYSYRSL